MQFFCAFIISTASIRKWLSSLYSFHTDYHSDTDYQDTTKWSLSWYYVMTQQQRLAKWKSNSDEVAPSPTENQLMRVCVWSSSCNLDKVDDSSIIIARFETVMQIACFLQTVAEWVKHLSSSGQEARWQDFVSYSLDSSLVLCRSRLSLCLFICLGSCSRRECRRECRLQCCCRFCFVANTQLFKFSQQLSLPFSLWLN